MPSPSANSTAPPAIGAGFTPGIRFQTASHDLAQARVGTGYGVALVSRPALTRVPGTTHRPPAEPPLHRDLHAVTRSDTALTPLAGVLRTLLLDVATGLRGAWTSQG
ncbi:LysR substrate-binding domain-containing protein [Streptomyces sp. NPDC001833]|uniref:LysR substrate-binding domain-containing protein n=1 Tax=Streptomyces sp. NPDC001833 TaxID=3154658 RepID=UPI00331F7790